MTTRSKWMLLILFIAVWVGLAARLVMDGGESRQVPLKHVKGQTASRQSGRGASLDGLKVNIDLLTANRQQADKTFATPRNIFAPLRGEEPISQVAQGGPPVPISPAIPPPPAPTPEEVARQAGMQELAQYRYLGYLIRGGRDQAFLSKGNDLHIVKPGETIDQRILIKAITPAGVTLQETGSQVEQTVTLTP
jgi:hypothetical protein